ncbi:hypothetical protein [Methanoregula formicica]|uniref:Uncharacterized protein n=1 Tax=Methanoregula formicica (strain DSM 22288 / NBRC 105244 / SMSP) TaxID=593750 RepID=L0HIY9_METFS|nr:hypothetical protein [Methanoregula formicica]AGB03736.1 hypothetical protein Metfor_2751 [Methanoregula formicica SMSP]
MSNQKMEKIYIAIQDIRTLALRTRPSCDDARDCSRCPAIVALPDRPGIACLFDIVQRKGEIVKRSVRKIPCGVCRKPMFPIASGQSGEERWGCRTPGCSIHEYARGKFHYLLQ